MKSFEGKKQLSQQESQKFNIFGQKQANFGNAANIAQQRPLVELNSNLKIKLQSSKNNINLIGNGISRNDRIPIAAGSHTNSYQQHTGDGTGNVLHNFSSRTVNGQIQIGAPPRILGTEASNSSQKKTRRLRKNFDLLSQALKNANTAKIEKKINFSQENRNAYENSGPMVGQIQNTYSHHQMLNIINSQQARNDQMQQIYQYGNPTKQAAMKDRKTSCYEVIGNAGGQNTSSNGVLLQNLAQSQRVPSETRNQHNMSLYSQISLKETPTPQKGHNAIGVGQSRNSHINSMHLQQQNLTQNPQHLTQPLAISNDQRTYMKVNDKLMRRLVAGTSSDLQQQLQNQSQTQAVLNISTAQDINIYNNSFILNTNLKKISHSQNQSRSNSLKRNQQITAAQMGPKFINQQQFQNIFGCLSNDYSGRQNQSGGIKSGNASGRSNSQSKMNNTVISNGGNEMGQKYHQISDAYNTQNGFGLPQNMKVVRKQGQKVQQRHSTSKAIKQESFDFQPINLSGVNNSSGINQNSKQMFKLTSNGSKPNMASSSGVQQQRDNYIDNMSSQDPNFSPPIKKPVDFQANKNKSNNLLIQGKKKLQDKDYQNAIKILSEAIQLDKKNMDAKFYRALSYLDSGLTKEAAVELEELKLQSPAHSQLTHILLSIAFKRNNDLTSAEKVVSQNKNKFIQLSECIDKHPSYPDAYLARGQTYIIMENYMHAQQDFITYTKLMPQNGAGFMATGDSYKYLNNWKEAINAYSEAIRLFQSQEPPQISPETQYLGKQLILAIMKRGLAYYNLKQYQPALADLTQAVTKDQSLIKAHFYIGKLLQKITTDKNEVQKLQNEAILHYEQVVKYQENEIYAGNALFEIAKIRLQRKDFYEAYFNLKRAVDSNFSSKRLQLYKDFTEGVLYLIKRKIKKGVQILSDLLEILVNSKDKKDKTAFAYLKHQAYIYRSYGYVAIEKYEMAQEDIKKAKKIAKIDAATIYNKLLGKGILRMDHEDYIMATRYFAKASLKFSYNKDPYCLSIISIVRSYSYSMQDMSIDQEEKRNKILETKLYMDEAILKCNKSKEPSLYFFRGLLCFQLQMFCEAIQNFNIAIEEEEEPTASYYLARGRAYACLSILTEAMKDLSIALNIEDTLQEAYIYRGKCAYLLGDNNLAFLDFQRLILTDPKNPMVHVYAGNLLMTTGAYQDAIKAYQNADTVQPTAVAAFQRARCYCAQTDLENAKMHFKAAQQLCPYEQLIQIDSSCLSALMKVINSSIGGKLNQQSIQSAISSINELIQFIESGQIKELKKKDAKLNIQIIPNVKRIKQEKIVVAKELVAQQNDQKELLSLSVDFNQTADLDSIKDVPFHSYYYENVFQLEDFYLFRAVFHFYKQDYEKSLQDYEYCSNLKQNTEKKQQNQNIVDMSAINDQESINMFSQQHFSGGSTPMYSMTSSKTDLSDVGLCSLNIHETNYNLLLCYLFMKDYTRCLAKLNEIIGSAPKKYQKLFFLIRGLVYEQLGQSEKAAKDLAKFEKMDSKAHDQFMKENKDLVFEPFPLKNRLCGKFDNVKLRIGKRTNALILKPSFSMPFIKPPNMIPNINEEVIQNEFNLKQIDAPMPEAPWIRRCEYGIKFTDQMVQDEEEEVSTPKKLAQNESSQSKPLKGKISKEETKDKSRYDKEEEEEQPYVQRGDASQKKQVLFGEQILATNMLCLVDRDDDEMSDKHKISIFEDSKMDDPIATLDNLKAFHENTQNNSMDMELLNCDDENGEDDDDDSSQEALNIQASKDRESLVLVGDNKISKKKKIKVDSSCEEEEDCSNPMMIMSFDVNEEKLKVLSELDNQIENEDECIDDARSSIFRSKQSSKR